MGEPGIGPDVLDGMHGRRRVIPGVLGTTAPRGIICLLGVSEPGNELALDFGRINRNMVLNNETMFGSVNANRGITRWRPTRSRVR